MLELLKKSGNIHYQFYDDYNVYTDRCKKEDFKGYTFVFDEDIEPIRDLNDKPETVCEEEIDGKCIDEIIEMEYIEKDPVRKYQLTDYNKSLCLSNMYPEVAPEN